MKTVSQTNKDKDIFQKIFLDHWPLFKATHCSYDDHDTNAPTCPVQSTQLIQIPLKNKR